MKEDIIYVRYKELAASAIIYGINEYLQGDYSAEYLKNWLEECTLLDYLNVNREALFERVWYMKRKGIKYVKGIRDYHVKNKQI